MIIKGKAKENFGKFYPIQEIGFENNEILLKESILLQTSIRHKLTMYLDNYFNTFISINWQIKFL